LPSTTQPWALSAALTNFYLGGSDALMMGGDVADYYAHSGSLDGLSLTASQAVVNSSGLGSQQQLVNSFAAQTVGIVKL
jgi:hypothetical protein